MRSNIELVVRGKNIDEILANAKKSWQGFINDPEADLPNDAELNAKEDESKEMIAYVTIRTKIERD
jgi:predicted RNase H-like HicB family nuclease